jgi:hypothetical protein
MSGFKYYNPFAEQLFWYDPKTYALNHVEFSTSADMYTMIQHLCQEKNSTINCWNLSNTGWYTSAMDGGSSPYKTNLHKVITDNVPKDIQAMCLILGINWRGGR